MILEAGQPPLTDFGNVPNAVIGENRELTFISVSENWKQSPEGREQFFQVIGSLAATRASHMGITS
ncbi:MAG: hypothetical protein JJD98_06245 [Polaromonas sp.]|nr:hypothetical protein [Polaromonas sp.]